jgi:hypothetical protein
MVTKAGSGEYYREDGRLLTASTLLTPTKLKENLRYMNARVVGLVSLPNKRLLIYRLIKSIKKKSLNNTF